MNQLIDTKITIDKFIISLSGKFDIDSHHNFRKAGNDAVTSDSQIIEIDLEKVEYIDSSALGMLLLLREKALAANKEVILSRCQEFVLRVLKVVSFNRLFVIQ